MSTPHLADLHGPALAAAFASEVLNLSLVTHVGESSGHRYVFERHGERELPLLPYERDLREAMRATEALPGSVLILMQTPHAVKPWFASFKHPDGRQGEAFGETHAEAVCRAGLAYARAGGRL